MLFTHATASRIKSYKSCEFKYFLEYMVQYPPMRDENIYSGKGSAVHEALEAWTNFKLGIEPSEDGPPVEQDWEKTLREYYAEKKLWELDDRQPKKDGTPRGFPHPVEKTCESCPWASKDGLCEIANQSIEAVNGCPRPNFQEDVDLIKRTLTRTDYNPLELDEEGNFKRKIIGAEVPFDMEIDGVQVRGVIDLVVEEDEETLEIVDYKTGKSMAYDKAFNDPQVRIYGKVAKILWPQYKYIMVTLHYLKKRPVTLQFDEQDDELTIKSLQKNQKEIRNNENPRRVTPSRWGWPCQWCIGHDNCGRIRDNFKVDGRFRLPTINCEYAGEQPCWGNRYPIKGQKVSVDTAHLIKYVCKGHAEISGGGEYICEEQPDDSS